MRNFGLALVLIVLTGAGCRETRHPDVILITLDTTRADHIGAYGYPRGTTPELDGFSREAAVYRRAWSTASWTLPAHASLFTGKHPTSHGAHFNASGGEASLGEVFSVPAQVEAASAIKVNRLGESHVTLAELLRDAGYATAAFAGGPWLAPVFGLMQGYDVVHARARNLGGKRADRLTALAIEWLREVPRDRPVHLLVNYFDPHLPYTPPAGFDDLPAAKLPLTIDPDQVMHGASLSETQRQAYIDRYDGEIRFMDQQFGRLMEALRESGRYESALIVVTSDHGETFGEHGLMGHARWLYEEVLRVPLLIRYPGAPAPGQQIEASVSLVDVLPLIAGEIGLEVPEGVEGVPVGEREVVIAESFRDALAVQRYGERFDRDLGAAIVFPWKLIQSDSGRAEVYDIRSDPGEHIDRSGSDIQERLRTALIEARGGLKAPEVAPGASSVDPDTAEELRALGYVE